MTHIDSWSLNLKTKLSSEAHDKSCELFLTTLNYFVLTVNCSYTIRKTNPICVATIQKIDAEDFAIFCCCEINLVREIVDIVVSVQRLYVDAHIFTDYQRGPNVSLLSGMMARF